MDTLDREFLFLDETVFEAGSFRVVKADWVVAHSDFIFTE